MQVRKLIIVLVVLAVVGAAYGIVVSLYSSSLSAPRPAPDPPRAGVALILLMDDVQPVEGQVSGEMILAPGINLTDNDGSLRERIDVEIAPAVVGAHLTYPAGLAPTAQQVVLPIQGEVQNYPLDTYDLTSFGSAYSVNARGERQHLYVMDSTYMSVAGWTSQEVEAPVVKGVAGIYGDDSFTVTLLRSPSTKMLAALLLAMLICLGTVAALVAIWVYRGRIKADFGPAGWMTAMLFAVLPLRGFFPGSPPIGAWMDILIVFWVILVIMLAVTSVAVILLTSARRRARSLTDSV